MPNDHTIVTATRAVVGAVRPDGTVHEARLVELAQHAVDDVYRRLELQQQRLDPAGVVVDVRVTAFVPAPRS
jgi:acyl-CoA thioesterase FadM